MRFRCAHCTPQHSTSCIYYHTITTTTLYLCPLTIWSFTFYCERQKRQKCSVLCQVVCDKCDLVFYKHTFYKLLRPLVLFLNQRYSVFYNAMLAMFLGAMQGCLLLVGREEKKAQLIILATKNSFLFDSLNIISFILRLLLDSWYGTQ